MVSIVGFADDINLLAYGRNAKACTGQLERAWKTCLQWAGSRGMTFAADKSVLIHFNKNRRQWANLVTLYQPIGASYSIVRPMPSRRFLGV